MMKDERQLEFLSASLWAKRFPFFWSFTNEACDVNFPNCDKSNRVSSE